MTNIFPYSIVRIRWPPRHTLRSNRDVCSNWNALVAAAETVDNRPMEKGLETCTFLAISHSGARYDHVVYKWRYNVPASHIEQLPEFWDSAASPTILHGLITKRIYAILQFLAAKACETPGE